MVSSETRDKIWWGIVLFSISVFIVLMIYNIAIRKPTANPLNNVKSSNKKPFMQNLLTHLNESIQSIKPTRKRIMKLNENKCRTIFESLFKRPFKSVRPTFLLNPTTNRLLELDGYNKELNLAFEYQGSQHYGFNKHFHRNYSDYSRQLERDAYKKKKCREMGIDLIIIPSSVRYEMLAEYIYNELRAIRRL